MKFVFIFTAAAAAGATAHAQPAPAVAPELEGVPDLDGDGDIDADDLAALKAAEVIAIEDKSDGARLAESARAVTVVDLRQARERTADLGEVLSRTHGVNVRRSGGLGAPATIALNGLSGPQIRFFIDGIPLELVGGLGVADLPVDFVQRVDIYRGVVPTSLGTDALGGAIDLVRDPSWTDRAAISYQVGSFGTHRASFGTRARDPETGLALGLSGFVDHARNDYAVDVKVADELGRPVPVTVRRFHDAYTAGGASVEAGLVRRGPLERALVRVFHNQYDKELQHNVTMAVPFGDAAYAGDSRGVLADLELVGGAWRGRLVLGGSRATTDFRDLGTTIWDWRGFAIGPRARPGELGDGAIHEQISELAAFARGSLERAFGAVHRVRIAIAPTRTERTGEDFLDSNPDGRDPIEARREVTQLVTGVEHEVKLRGGRLENLAFAKHYLLATDVEDVRPGYVFVPLSSTRHRLGFGDSARYQLSRRTIAKASYELATRLPTTYELFGDGVLVGENLALVPESSHNVNLGVQLDRETSWGAWRGDASAFARLVSNQILLVGSDRNLAYQNVQDARILGIEGLLGWEAPGGWARVTANGTVQDQRNTSSAGPYAPYQGDRLPNRPWLLGSLDASVRRRGALRANDELALFATSRYVRGVYRSWESAGLPGSKQVIPSQLVHGVGVTYAARGKAPIITTIELQNLTDARAYDTFGVQRPGRALYVKLSGEL